MSPETIFSSANLVAVVCWLLLIVMPRRRWASHTVAAVAGPLLFAGLYAGIVAVKLIGAPGGFDTLADVST